MKELVLICATIFGALAIIFGAFGAHSLKKILSLDQLASFETGVKYQMYHAIVLLVLGLQLNFDKSLEMYAAYSFIVGTVLFSFSIFGLCISSAKGKKLTFLGPITPIGGLCLTLGWVFLLICFM